MYDVTKLIPKRVWDHDSDTLVVPAAEVGQALEAYAEHIRQCGILRVQPDPQWKSIITTLKESK